jgi:hypothetical protein
VGIAQLSADGRPVVRAVGDARHHDDNRGTGVAQLARSDVGQVLGLVVVAEKTLRDVAAIALVDDPAVRVAEDVDRRGMDDPGNLGFDGGLEDAVGRTNVRVVHRRAFAFRDADPVVAGEVDDPVGPAHAADERLGRAEVAGPQLAAELDEMAGTIRIANDGHDVVTSGPELEAHGAADEARATRDEDAHQAGCARDATAGIRRPGIGSVDRRVRSDRLEPRLDVAEERGPAGTVVGAVVDCENHVHHRPDRDDVTVLG